MCTTHFRQAVLCLLLLVLCAFTSHAQEASPKKHFIPWASDGLSTRLESSGNYAYTCFQVLDDGQTVAFLSMNEPEILIYDLQNPDRPIQRIALLEYADEMTFSNGLFYVSSTTAVHAINRTSGTVEQTWAVKRPEGEPFIVHQIRKIGSQVLLLTADERTHLLNTRGRSVLDEKQWRLTNTLYGRTEKLNDGRFRLDLTWSGQKSNREISTANLGLPGKLGTVTLIGTINNAVCLDIEMAFDQPGADVRRFFVFLSSKGKMVSKMEVPMHYYTYTRRDVSYDGKDIFFAMSTEKGVYLMKIEPKQELNIPAIKGQRYHYNEHLPAIDNLDENQSVVLSPDAGSNCVTRTQIYENAFKFRDLQWTATASNITSTCTTSSSKYYRTPIWVTAGSKSSVPYKWGGWTDWTTYRDLVLQGRKCGSYATPGNGVCSTPVYDSSSDGVIIGDDCSGFVSRCWELSTKYGTAGLPDISANLGSASSTTGFNALKVGDIINKSGDHTRICLGDNPTGSVTFIEASAVDWRVNDRSYNMTALTGYTALRFNHVTDARLRLNQAISITPTLVNQGCPLTVSYAVKNFGTESWSGEVQLWIIQSTGAEVLLKADLVTLNANTASSAFTFSSAAVSSPTGVSKLEVRLKNSSACNYSRAYKAGNGSFTNPVTFTIGNSCSGSTPANDNCIGAIYLPVGSACSYTAGNNTGATASIPGPLGGCPNSGLKDVWFHFYMPNVTNPFVTIRSIAGSMTDGVMEVYQGLNCNSLTYITCEDDNTNGNGSYMPVIGLQGGPNNHIWVRFWGYSGSTGSFNICVFNYQSNSLTGGGNSAQTIPMTAGQMAVLEREASNSGTSIPRKDMRDSVEIYPNPAQDRVNLSFNQIADCNEMTYCVYSALGKMVAKQTIQHGESGWRTEEIDASAWKPGIYTIQLSICTGNYTEKLLIIRN